MVSLDKKASTPLHRQIKNILKENINKGEYLPSGKIQSEIELATMLNVSRMTVNKAINELAREGLLNRHQGKGTFVSVRKIDQWFFRITSFNKDMLSRGLIPSTYVLAKKTIRAPKEVRLHLNLSPHEKVILVKRLRCANNDPIVLETRYLNYRLSQKILNESLEKDSIHDLLIYKYHLPLTKVNQSLEAVSIGKEEAKLLGVKPYDPAFLLSRVTFTKNDPVTWVTYLYRGDKYRFQAEFVPTE